MPSAPAKRAAFLMIAIGVLLLAGSFVSTMYALLLPEWIDAQLRQHKEIFADNPMLKRPALTWTIAVFGGLGLIESGLSIALGLWILRGKRWAIVTSLILTALRLLIVGLVALLAVVASALEAAMKADDKYAPAVAATKQSPSNAIDIGISVFATVVLALLAVWLVQALRADRRARVDEPGNTSTPI